MKATNDQAFYMSIWNEREHVCQVCGTYLGKEPRTYMFEHLLEKGDYPQFRHEKRNIILICLSDHDCKTRGFPKLKHQEFIDKAKEELL